MNRKRHTAEGGSPQGPKSYSRRDAIASIAGLALAASAVAADAADLMQSSAGGPSDLDPDRELKALGVAMEQSWSAEKAYDAATKDDHSDHVYQEFEDIMDVTRSIVRRIEVLPALTISGLIVKARAVSWCNGGDADVAVEMGEGNATDVRLAASLVCDLLKMNEARGA